MARMNVYLPDELADQVRAAGLNVSQLTQQAVRRALAGSRTDAWLHGMAAMSPAGVDHGAVVDAVHGARDELDRG